MRRESLQKKDDLARMLTVFPQGGLANRLYAVHSAIHLAQDIAGPLRIVWTLKSECGARLDALFHKPPELDHLVAFDQLNSGIKTRLGNALTWAKHRPMIRQGTAGRHIRDWSLAGYDFTELAASQAPSFRAFSLFYKPDVPFYPFRPLPHLQARIDAAIERPAQTIGVHIRRTDNVQSIRESPTHLFTDALDRHLQTAPETQIFLATDDPKLNAQFAERFGAALIPPRERVLDRADPAGIEDAVVDVFALGRCPTIYGSSGSTFSDLAARLGGATLHILRNAR